MLEETVPTQFFDQQAIRDVSLGKLNFRSDIPIIHSDTERKTGGMT
jgi:hypothetical protein